MSAVLVLLSSGAAARPGQGSWSPAPAPPRPGPAQGEHQPPTNLTVTLLFSAVGLLPPTRPVHRTGRTLGGAGPTFGHALAGPAGLASKAPGGATRDRPDAPAPAAGAARLPQRTGGKNLN